MTVMEFYTCACVMHNIGSSEATALITKIGPECVFHSCNESIITRNKYVCTQMFSARCSISCQHAVAVAELSNLAS